MAARVGGVSIPYFDSTRDIGASGEGVVLSLCGDRSDGQAVEEIRDVPVVEEPCRITGADLETIGFCLSEWSRRITASTAE